MSRETFTIKNYFGEMSINIYLSGLKSAHHFNIFRFKPQYLKKKNSQALQIGFENYFVFFSNQNVQFTSDSIWFKAFKSQLKFYSNAHIWQ